MQTGLDRFEPKLDRSMFIRIERVRARSVRDHFGTSGVPLRYIGSYDFGAQTGGNMDHFCTPTSVHCHICEPTNHAWPDLADGRPEGPAIGVGDGARGPLPKKKNPGKYFSGKRDV